MAIYTFNTVLLSAQKTGSPNLQGTTLSASGVNTISLSANDVGIAFNSVTPVASTISCNVAGSIFVIDKAYTGSTMGIVKTSGGYSTFPFLSSVTTVPISAFSTSDSVSTPDTRRKRNLGY